MKRQFIYKFVKKYHITKPLFIGFFVAFAVIGYFSYFTIFGDKGLIALVKADRKIKNKEAIRQEFILKLKAKESLVNGMKTESLDLDLLDEESRKVLGYAGKNEVIIYQKNKNDETEK